MWGGGVFFLFKPDLFRYGREEGDKAGSANDSVERKTVITVGFRYGASSEVHVDAHIALSPIITRSLSQGTLIQQIMGGINQVGQGRSPITNVCLYRYRLCSLYTHIILYIQ